MSIANPGNNSVVNLGNEWAKGSGIFETIRVQDNQVFALHRHHCRAKECAERLGIEIPSEEEVALASYQVIHSCDYPLGRLRWHFDRNGDFSIAYSEYQDPKAPAKLMIVDNRSNNYQVRVKEYPYKNLELLEKIQSFGYDDGIILTEDGQVSETAIASLLLLIDGDWVTPPLSSGILNGVVRALVLEAGMALVRRIDESELARVTSGLLLTSLRNAQPIASIADRELEIAKQKCDEIHALMASFKGK